MKRIIPAMIMALGALIAVLAVLPGCDDLITQYNYDTTFITIQDSTCVAACHSDANMDMLIAIRQWEHSRHSSDSLIDFDEFGLGLENTKTCGPQCHNQEGFITSLQSSVDEIEFPLEIGCFSCHAPHTYWELDSLRYYDPVVLADGFTYNRGNSNICALCHQATATVASAITDQIDLLDSVTIYPSWAAHASNQADMMMGTGGYEYGAGPGNSAHYNASGSNCVKCHMNVAIGFELGGHSFTMESDGDQLVEACNVSGCHIGSPLTGFTDVSADQTSFIDSLSILHTALETKGITDDYAGKIGDAGLAGALYNYRFIINDGSNGVHNTDYALGLIRESLIYLDTATSLNP
ncbi:MAG: hypothetical protein JW763_03300 [candidate division Zixibacteria bacterium]|nr:hypothetical protein [candidate division Zixibacteria bacterium]